MIQDLVMTKNLFLLVCIILLVIIIAVYVVVGIVLSKLNKVMYGYSTPMAWIPCCNIYLLGKLTFNKWVGWLLLILGVLSSSQRYKISGNEIVSYSYLPFEISPALYVIYSIIMIGLFIYAIIKYYRLK